MASARLSPHHIGWIATGIVLINGLGAALAIFALGDVQYSQAATRPVAQPVPSKPVAASSATSRLVFRSQKSGTNTQLHQAQLRRQELVFKQKTLPKVNPVKAHQTAAAIAQIDHLILTQYESATLDNSDISHVWVNRHRPTEITLQFTAAGSQKFAHLTQRLAGTDRTLGIFLNGKLVATPPIAREYTKTGMTGGKVQISGNFTPPQAMALAQQHR
jgi:preprotein translocase subunit SecD